MKGISLLLLFTLFSCASEAPVGKGKSLASRLRQCYLESDSYTSKPLGNRPVISVELKVTPENQVEECKVVRSQFKDPNLNTCVCEQYKDFEFTNPTSQTIKLLQPVTFNPVTQ